MVYSLCARGTTAPSTCTPDDYIGTVLSDGCCKIIDIRVFYALHDRLRSERFELRYLRFLANDGMDGVR